jgi:thioredoxin-dependent peroxiredoxin
MTTKTKSELEGKKAPAISLKDENGDKFSLKDQLGSYVLIYFYPKDDTPGCTTEACSIRDHSKQINKASLKVFGISPDDETHHQKFIGKYNLNFPLLCDTEHKVAEKYEVWVEKNMYGKKYMGIQRDSFLIDPNGTIVKHYKKVKPDDHIGEVLEDLKGLKV